MSYIITDKSEVFVDFREDGTPEWSGCPEIEEVARQFITKEEATSARDELRALGLNPKIVKWDNPNAPYIYKDKHKAMKGNKLGVDTVMRFRAWLDNRLGRRRFAKPFPERARARLLKNEELMSQESEWDADLAERCGKGLLSLQDRPRQRYNRWQSDVSLA